MRIRYLARIKVNDLPKKKALNESQVHLVLDVAGWTVTHQEVRDYGAEYWVTLERDIPVPKPLHPCCEVYGDKSVTVFVGDKVESDSTPAA